MPFTETPVSMGQQTADGRAARFGRPSPRWALSPHPGHRHGSAPCGRHNVCEMKHDGTGCGLSEKTIACAFSPGTAVTLTKSQLGLRQPLKTEVRMCALARGCGLADGWRQTGSHPLCPRQRIELIEVR